MKDKEFEKEKKRRYSEAEQRRFDRFKKICEELASQGYKQVDLTVGIVKANVFALALIVPVYGLGYFLFFRRHSFSDALFASPLPMLLFLVVYFVLIFVHEGLHGITWAAFAKNHAKDIEFGFMKEYLTPYCTCLSPLPKGPYILGALMPLLVLGILPTLWALCNGSLFLLNIGLIMILSAGGDILIVIKILVYPGKAGEIFYYDHPTQAGGVIFEK